MAITIKPFRDHFSKIQKQGGSCAGVVEMLDDFVIGHEVSKVIQVVLTVVVSLAFADDMVRHEHG